MPSASYWSLQCFLGNEVPTTNLANKLGKETVLSASYTLIKIHVNIRINKEAKLLRDYGIRVAYIGKTFETNTGKHHQEIISFT